MRRLALVPTLIAALLLPSGAQALGLGEIEIQSALNQRLDAEIPLRGVPEEQGDEVEVSLAPEEAFNRADLGRPFALTRLRFAVKQRDGGGHYVHITSRDSIVEPFLSFLIEVDWSGGNLLREYTVLLDPPVFASEDDSQGSGGGTTDTARTSETSDESGVTGEIERESESAGREADDGAGQTGSDEDKPVFLDVEERENRARAEADEQVAGESGGGSAGAPQQYGPVDEGETLWSIANRLRSGDMTVQQMMIALLRYNPDAFSGNNINRLRQGYVLRVPESDRVLEVSAQRALARVREQNSVWQELQEGSRSQTSVAASDQGSGDAGDSGEGATGPVDPELSIVGADEGGASSDEAASATGSSSDEDSEKLQLAQEQLESTRLEKEELESRVNELEQTVSKMEKLLEVRDARLSALQEELRELDGRGAPDEDSDTAADDEATDDESGTAVASVDDADDQGGDGARDGESVAESGDGDETAAAGDGDEDGEAGTAGTDGGAGDGETQVATDAETTSDDPATADAADADAESDEKTASAGDQADGSNIPEDKLATDADRGVETTRTEEPRETWLDQVNGAFAAVTGIFAGVGGGLLGGPLGLALAAAIVLLLGGGLILMRRRREAAESGDLDDFAPGDTSSDIEPIDTDSSGEFDAGPSAVDADDGAAPSTDGRSALMDEEFDLAAIEGEEAPDRGAVGPVEEPARGGSEDDEAEADDTVAEADVYLAYGLHQQAEDLLRLALREHPGNAVYHEKLLETLYAGGKTGEFIEQAETFRGVVDGPQNRLWQRVLAMGRELAPEHALFAEGDTEYTTADLQAARPAETDLELDDSDDEIDFGFDDEPESPSSNDAGPAGNQEDDEFSNTMMLDSADFKAVEGDGGLLGPGDDRSGADSAETPGPANADADDEEGDLEFDLGDLDGLSGDESSGAASGPDTGAGGSDDIEFDLDEGTATGPAGAESDESVRSGGEADDDALDFDLDFEEPESPKEGLAGIDEPDSPQTESPVGAESDDNALDFDFDLEDTPTASGPGQTAAQETAPSEPAGGDDDESLEIGDLEIGDLESLDTGSEEATDSADAGLMPDQAAGEGNANEADAFDLSDLDSGLDSGFEQGPEEAAADKTPGASGSGTAGATDDDAFDLSDLDALGSGAEDDVAFNLDDSGTTGSEAPETRASGPSTGESAAAAGAAGAGETAADEDDEFDTMLDLARAYIDMGDPESATNALEEVASSGNEQQRSEAQSLLDSVR